MKLNNLNKIYFFYFFILVIFSHFIPFERSSLAPDDYSLMMNNTNGLENFLIYPDRPILYIFLELLYFIFGDENFLYFIFLVFLNLFNVLVVFYFYNLFINKETSLIITTIYSLLFVKLEIFHNSIMIHICLVTTLYLISLYLLLKITLNYNRLLYFLSIVLFLLCIFWYEIGFFLPFLIFFYNQDKNKVKLNTKILFLLPFIVIILLYSLIRITNFFGYAYGEETHSININLIYGIYDFINHHFGTYAIRNILYGLYQFTNIDVLYILLFIFINSILCLLLFKFNKNNNLENKNLNFFFFMLLIFSIIPIILNGEAGGRNLLISSISISYFIYKILKLFVKNFNNIFVILLFVGLLISQGNSWSQYKASKLQKLILESLYANKEKIINSDYVIFNTFSLKEKINFSFTNKEFNLINTYFGAQVWEIWGIKGFMKSKNIYNDLIIINKNPIYDSDKVIISKVTGISNYSIQEKQIELSNKNLFILDYEKIFLKQSNF